MSKRLQDVEGLNSRQSFRELHHLHNYRNLSSDDFTLLVEEKLPSSKRIDRAMTKTYFKLGKKLYIFDNDWRQWRGGGEGENRVISPRSDYSYIDAHEDDESKMFISGSYCGLVVLHHKLSEFSRNLIIMNPIFPDNKVKIKVTETSNMIGKIFGVFLHPVLKEFCILWCQTQTRQPQEHNIVVDGYKLLNLGPSQSRWRNLNNTGNIVKKQQQPRVGVCKLGTLGVTSPVVLDDVLYWMVDERAYLDRPNPKFCEEAIMGFDTKTEEFHFLPHPAPCPCCQKNFRGEDLHNKVFRVMCFQQSMHLLQKNNNNSHLSLCQFSRIDDDEISIWIFKKEEILPSSAPASYNVNQGSWIKTHTITLNDHHIMRSSNLNLLSYFRPIAMIDEELLLMQWQRLDYLFVCNLKLGTCERFESKRETVMCAHTPTLFPIRNSNPEIILSEE